MAGHGRSQNGVASLAFRTAFPFVTAGTSPAMTPDKSPSSLGGMN